jgi:hypothetical protein
MRSSLLFVLLVLLAQQAAPVTQVAENEQQNEQNEPAVQVAENEQQNEQDESQV